MKTSNFVLFLLCLISVIHAHNYPVGYSCPLCEDFLQRTVLGSENMETLCTHYRACDLLLPKLQATTIADIQAFEGDVYKYCINMGMCIAPHEEMYTKFLPTSAASAVNLRVSRAYGTRGYNQLRVSIIDNATTAASRPESFKNFFSYSQAFQYRWTNMHVFSTLVNVTPGQPNTVSIGNVTVTLSIPKEDAPTRGVLVADPCFSSRWVFCTYGNSLNIYSRLTSILNAAMANPNALDFWMILGDNFYDRDGSLGTQFFSSLSQNVLSTPFAGTAGNHDFWVFGSPWLSSSPDQYGNGFMQFYTMDTYASLSSTNGLFNFTNNPDHPSDILDDHTRLASPDNFFFVQKVGNVAFMGYSGAHTFDVMDPYFRKGCQYFADVKPQIAFLIGHWNTDDFGTGSTADMTVPAVHAEIKAYPGCSDLGSRFKYIMGHTHCNQIVEADTGFMVAGQGMEGCGNFGIPYVDTNNGRLEVLYFAIADQQGTDNWNPLIQCVTKQGGLHACKQYATVWYNGTLN